MSTKIFQGATTNMPFPCVQIRIEVLLWNKQVMLLVLIETFYVQNFHNTSAKRIFTYPFDIKVGIQNSCCKKFLPLSIAFCLASEILYFNI